MKKLYKQMQNIGRYFCIYNTHKTGHLTIYRYQGKTYAKTRDAGSQINGVDKLVLCRPAEIGVRNVFIEI